MNKCLPIVLMLIAIIVSWMSSSLSASEQKITNITVIVGSNAACGSHGGSFEAKYQNRPIEIMFGHDPSPANPIKQPLKVFDQKGEVADWSEIICPSYPMKPPYNISITGKKVAIAGRWKNKKAFEAYKIYLNISH